MSIKHQQTVPADLEVHPRPSEREIYLKPASQTHRERPSAAGGGFDE